MRTGAKLVYPKRRHPVACGSYRLTATRFQQKQTPFSANASDTHMRKSAGLAQCGADQQIRRLRDYSEQALFPQAK